MDQAAVLSLEWGEKLNRIDLNSVNQEPVTGHTSKGDQPKWHIRDSWYKADHMGTESLSEILISAMLSRSNISDFVTYAPIMISYHDHDLRGCVSQNFRADDEMLVPFERLHRTYQGIGLAKALAAIPDTKEKIRYTVDFVERITKLTDVGPYLTTILELDGFTLNEDRHTNNLAVIRNEKILTYRLCPIFDNGLALLSDLNDYPLEQDVYACIDKVHAKPFSYNFDEQIECAESLYGSHLKFSFKKSDIYTALDGLAGFYPKDILNRAERVILEQMRRW